MASATITETCSSSPSSSSTKGHSPVRSNKQVTPKPWYKRIAWFNFLFSIGVPILALFEARRTPLDLRTAKLSIVYFWFTGISITAGYHRLWSHRAYKATAPLSLLLALLGAAAVQGSAFWWAKHHRAHHRFTDTDRDPYSAHKGLFHSHIGWILLKRDRGSTPPAGRVDMSDLDQDKIVQWQHRNFVPLSLGLGLVLPVLICGYGWGDWRGGIVYAAVLRMAALQQCTFCVNSLAHYIGSQPYADRHTPKDHIITALITFGEGWHNFHHTFPADYRNGWKWWHYDPTKWLIWSCEKVGLAKRLQRFEDNEIKKSSLLMREKMLAKERASFIWGPEISSLPIMTWEEFQVQSRPTSIGGQGKDLIVIAGVVHSVTDFIKKHPGGEALIRSGVGKDCTAAFLGGVYEHSETANSVLAMMRVARLKGGGKVEVEI
ncbi:acyl-CoA desaturase [Xylogone sp. PMI_703]|nr:acyl-CoA desaturase [Xylogone sp. PMI_703]